MQGYLIGTIRQILAASLVPKSRVQTVRTEVHLASGFVLQVATFCIILDVYFTPSLVFHSISTGL